MNMNNITKKKQYLLLGLVFALLFGIAFFVVAVKENAKISLDAPEPDAFEETIERYSGIGSNVDEDQIWRARSSNQMDEMDHENMALRSELKVLRSEIDRKIRDSVTKSSQAIKEELTTSQDQEINTLREQTKKLLAKTQASVDKQGVKTKESLADDSASVSQIQVNRKFFERNNGTGTPGGIGDYKGNDLYKEPEPALKSLSFAVEVVSSKDELDRLQKSVSVVEAERTGLTAENYVPAGTFVRSILIGGVDAPTGGQSQEDPYPVVLEVEDMANMPNDFEYDFRECRIIGAAHGDISSERVVVRLERMSCIDAEGFVFESIVKGFVYDETGKAGIKGRLVSKQGQLIANSLLAGIGSGIGKAFQESSTNYTTSALGVQQEGFISADEAMVAGLGGGVGTSMDRLSQYFIKLADQLFPVIEADAGRMLDVLFTKGFSMVPLTEEDLAEYQQGAENNLFPTKNKNGSMLPATIGDVMEKSSQTIQQAQGLVQSAAKY
jgi:hypothetical protein